MGYGWQLFEDCSTSKPYSFIVTVWRGEAAREGYGKAKPVVNKLFKGTNVICITLCLAPP